MTENDRLVFQVAVDHFRHDLVAFWNHSTFFALLQGALISVAVTNLGPPSADANVDRALLEAKELATLVAVAGLMFGLFWAMVAWRRAVLIQRWREQVVHLDGRVDRHGVYLRVEPDVADYWWYGPTKLTVALPYVILSIWLVILTVIWNRSALPLALFAVLSAWVLVVIGGVVRVRRALRRRSPHASV